MLRSEELLKEHVILAFDRLQPLNAVALACDVAGKVRAIKMNSLFMNGGWELARYLSDAADIFLDLKFKDIPATVRAHVFEMARHNVVSMCTVHALGGIEMMRAAVAGRQDAIDRKMTNLPPKILGITILTSQDIATLRELFPWMPEGVTVREIVVHLARMAKEAGLDGVVCSVEESADIREVVGPDFTIVNPAIRPVCLETDAQDDQKRKGTPKSAFQAGANMVVIGRPVLNFPEGAERALALLGEELVQVQ